MEKKYWAKHAEVRGKKGREKETGPWVRETASGLLLAHVAPRVVEASIDEERGKNSSNLGKQIKLLKEVPTLPRLSSGRILQCHGYYKMQ